MNTTASTIVQFNLPDHLACPKPTEDRNLARDEVRLLVTKGPDEAEHVEFSNLDSYLKRGDVLVINTSATRPSAFFISLPEERKGVLHLSTRLNAREWLIEIREIKGTKTIRWNEGTEKMTFSLPEDSFIRLKKKFYKDHRSLDLWIAEFNTTHQPETLMTNHGRPIKYDKLDENYPLEYYQTLFSFHPGSSEMPSAGRGFTPALIEKLLNKGIVFAPILLHTGISSLEDDETPYPEYMEVSPLSALMINHAKDHGHRIVAIGTTAVRAIESAVNHVGKVRSYQGNTSLFIEENYDMKVVDGLLTGFHEPRASHLHMLQSLAGAEHIQYAYETAVAKNYYWHQFGDLHLILP